MDSLLPLGQPFVVRQRAGALAEALQQPPLPRAVLVQLPQSRHAQAVWAVTSTAALRTSRRVRAAKRRYRNSSAGLLSALAVGSATLASLAEPSRRPSPRRQTVPASRRFLHYSWEETGRDGRELRVYVPVGPGVRHHDLRVELTESQLRIGVKGEPAVIDSDLCGLVKPEDSFWSIESRSGRNYVELTLIKQDPWEGWQHLTRAEASSTIGNRVARLLLITSCLMSLCWRFLYPRTRFLQPLQLLQVGGCY
eukprot:TRINITY_DN20891_c0_g1_i1.p1 TRINITY_DN20891_c0_g1~~TRINITY_DN20891_c0_g1_i1.p1  ORF type:complete len:252 (-),score=41.84 TRINITY_DN20891_c0_g1_i1:71-826(-)